ncbi:nicotinate-nucleotide adenylyltransferase [Haloferula luteola]|uniref:Probable nicotinate-nucleotide adenylyltransferase n=1 Tax=Haloferula luteola TaxID=595692 RepID=A0A840UXU8_9BACT|nr:nicotinate (nicotinamide) nucleotide adenylyltransferase [Haloferula luteola]MBB5350977.1 nicotinate-nucleotide adenylyltransferase [Haloferula luteola]
MIRFSVSYSLSFNSLIFPNSQHSLADCPFRKSLLRSGTMTPSASHSTRIALFGGSFDPVHDGHIEISRRAMDQAALDRVIFLPCRISPHKADGPLPASGEDRLELLRLATADLPWATIDDFDLTAPPPSYSFRTVEEMTRRHPEAKLFWLLGRDQWEALPRWKEPERLARSVEFLVFSREGAPVPRPGWSMQALQGVHPASSTAIRRALAAGRPPDHLHPAVLAAIRARGLYGVADLA